MDTTAETRANRSTATRYPAQPPPPPPPPPPHPPLHLSPLHHIHHHHLHRSAQPTAAAATLLMTPTGILDSSSSATEDARYGQSPGATSSSRGGIPHDLGRPGPPHASPAASVSAPSPLPPMQCQDRFFSSLTINTGSNYAYLNGVPAPAFSAASISAPMSASSPFRTPPGLASVHSHWSHTPPPSPLDSYGRYGLGTSLYSLYPMLTGNDANALCLQASAAKLLQRASPFYPILDRSRDYGLYHPANFSMGSPFSPSLSSLDSSELSGGGTANGGTGGLPDYLQQRLATGATPFDYICKTNNSGSNNFGNGVGGASGSNHHKFVGSKVSGGFSAGGGFPIGGSGTEEEKNKKLILATAMKESRAKSRNLSKTLSGGSNCRSTPLPVSSNDQKVSGSDPRCCVVASQPSVVKKESRSVESCKKKAVQKQSNGGGTASSGFVTAPSADVGQVQALNLSQDVKKSAGITTPGQLLHGEYVRLYGTSFVPFDPSSSLQATSSYTTSASPSSVATPTIGAATNVCDNNIRVKVEPEVKSLQYQFLHDSPMTRSDAADEKHEQKQDQIKSQCSLSDGNRSIISSEDCNVLNLITHPHNNNRVCCSKDVSHSQGPSEKCQSENKKPENVIHKRTNSTEKNSLCSPTYSKTATSAVDANAMDTMVTEESIKSATVMKDEISNKVSVKGSHIESITNKLLAKSQLGVGSEVSNKTSLQQQPHTKCRRKSVAMDKIVVPGPEIETKHSTSQLIVNKSNASEENCDSPIQAAPYDYTLKQPSCNSTFTVTTTSPVTTTTTTMAALQPIPSDSSFQKCFTEHVHKSITSSHDLNMSEVSSCSSAGSSSSSPINVTDIDSSPSINYKSNSTSNGNKMLSRFASKGKEIVKSKLSSPHESSSNSSAEGSSIFSHSSNTGVSTIPIGIAVAQQRQDGQTQCKQRKESLNCKQEMQKCGSQSVASMSSKSKDILPTIKSRPISNDILLEKNKLVCFDKSSSGDASGVSAPTSEYASSLMIAGGAPLTSSCWDNDEKSRWFPPALWLGQSSYPGAPTSLSMQLGTGDPLAASLQSHPPSHPFPPIGYQLARDPITNHLFLIPTTNINLMERPPLWPTAPPVTQLPTLHKPFQSCIFSPALPTTVTTSASLQQQQISSPIIAANRLMQERQHFDYTPKSEKPININGMNVVTSSQNVSESASEILSEKSLGKDESEDGNTSSLKMPPIAISQSYIFDLQTNNSSEISNLALAPSPPIPCACLATPGDSKISSETDVTEPQLQVENIGSLKCEMGAKMADACNQTETPPLTDDEEEEDISKENVISSHCLAAKDETNSAVPVVKVEDISVQCELSVEIEMAPEEENNKEEMNTTHGLELLSKTITECNLGALAHQCKTDVEAESEAIKRELNDVSVSASEREQNEESLLPHNDEFGGLGLLCALAEQRILQETNANSPPTETDPTPAQPNEEAADISNKEPKINKEYRHFIAQKMSQYSTTSSSSNSSSPSTSSSNSVCNKSLVGTENLAGARADSEMDSSEIEMRLKLADLQMKYKEKQKELAKLARKNSAEHSKRKTARPKKRKKSTKSSFKFHQLHRAKLSLLSCHKKDESEAGIGVNALERTTDSNAGRTILNPPTLVTPSLKNMSALDKWTTSLAACPPSLFQLVPTLKKSSATMGNIAKSSATSNIFPNLKQNLPPPTSTSSSSSGLVTAKLSFASLTASVKPVLTEVASPSKGQTTTPDETTTETSDSDDSGLCQPSKAKTKPITSKSRSFLTSGQRGNGGRRKEFYKNGCGSSSRSRGMGLGDEQREDSRLTAEVDNLALLIMQTGSLSVSCTMPPFKGLDDDETKEQDARILPHLREEDATDSGLGLLAICASQATTAAQLPVIATTSLTSGMGLVKKEPSTAEVLEKEIKEEPKEATEAEIDTSIKEFICDVKVKTEAASEDSVNSEICKKEESLNLTSLTNKCKYSYLEDEAWMRRRSERIFLNEPSGRSNQNYFKSFQYQNESSANRQRTPSVGSTLNYNTNNNCSQSGGVSREITVSAAVNAASAVAGLNWKSRLDETKLSKKRNGSKIKLESEPALKKVKLTVSTGSKLTLSVESEDQETADKNLSSESDIDSPTETSSFSEGDNLPLSQLVDRPITPAPRSCGIQAEELKDNQRVLTMIDRLFYAGRVVAIRAPDVYGITVDGERGNRPHIYSREEILQEAVMDVKPGSKRYLREGTRVCAYWSQQYRCLYPGTVAKTTSPSSSPEAEDTVLVEFDDGDSGRISVDNVRLLPPNLPLISYDRDPLNIGKRRTKSTGDISQEKRSPIVVLTDNQNENQSRSADKLRSCAQDENNFSLSTKEMSNVSKSNENKSSSNTSAPPAQRKLFEAGKKSDGKKIHDEVNNNNNSNVQSKMNDLNRIPLVKALYGSQILSATVSVVPLSRSSTPTSSVGSTCSKAVRNLGTGFSSSSSTSSLLKARKHKKHKNNKNDSRKKHHHHHRRHRHKHRHEKKQESILKEQNNALKLAEKNDVGDEENQSMNTSVDGKKQELTLKIRTSVDGNRGEVNSIDSEHENVEDSKPWSDEKNLESSIGGQISINKSETKANLLDEPLPPRKAKTAKKEDTSIVNCSRPKAKRKERSNSVETKSKIAAFLPARQLWRWSGKSYRRPGAKGKAKKDFYKAITRGKETIRVGDSAVFLSTGRPHLPFIGRIITMWESWGGNMIVKVRWFYHPEETKGGKKLVFNKGALYQSYHIDENDVQTISHKCEVLAWNDYRKYKDQDANQSSGSSVYDNCDVYYLAGSYDPTAGVVTLEEGVS